MICPRCFKNGKESRMYVENSHDMYGNILCEDGVIRRMKIPAVRRTRVCVICGLKKMTTEK